MASHSTDSGTVTDFRRTDKNGCAYISSLHRRLVDESYESKASGSTSYAANMFVSTGGKVTRHLKHNNCTAARHFAHRERNLSASRRGILPSNRRNDWSFSNETLIKLQVHSIQIKLWMASVIYRPNIAHPHTHYARCWKRAVRDVTL